MSIIFYPHENELDSSTLAERLEALLESAERYKAAVLDASKGETQPRGVPKDLTHAYNWDEIAKTLREIRDLSEANQESKLLKAERLAKLAEIYETLRGAKMSKLEAVRLALMNEVGQLRSGH